MLRGFPFAPESSIDAPNSYHSQVEGPEHLRGKRRQILFTELEKKTLFICERNSDSETANSVANDLKAGQ